MLMKRKREICEYLLALSDFDRKRDKCWIISPATESRLVPKSIQSVEAITPFKFKTKEGAAFAISQIGQKELKEFFIIGGKDETVLQMERDYERWRSSP